MRSRIPAVVFGLLLATAAQAGAPTTREDLLLAHREDVNERARYAAFAAQADREGHAYVARLFRASAAAEGVHAARHARALRRLGAEPDAALAPFEVKGTRLNLLRALAHEGGELRRRDLARGERARREGNAEAERGFLEALAAHEQLVGLYREAVRDLAQEREPGGGELHVCGTCGHVHRGAVPDRCPVSGSPAATFARVD